MRFDPADWRKRFWKLKFWNGFGEIIPDPTLWEAIKGFVLWRCLDLLAGKTFHRILKYGFLSCIAFLLFLRVAHFCNRHVLPLLP